MAKVPITCIDETKVELSLAAARLCDVFKGLIGDLPDAEALEQDLAVADITSENLKKAVPFLEHAAANPVTRPTRPLLNKALDKDGADAFSVTFIRDLPLSDVFEVLQVADSLSMDALKELSAARIAEHYLSYTEAQKDILFNNGKKMTEEEEKRLAEAHAWAATEPDIDAAYITKLMIDEGTLNADGTVPAESAGGK